MRNEPKLTPHSDKSVPNTANTNPRPALNQDMMHPVRTTLMLSDKQATSMPPTRITPHRSARATST